ASTVENDNEFLSIVVKYPDDVLTSMEEFENIEIANDEGEYVALNEVAELEEADMLPLITRDSMEETSELTITYAEDMSLNEAGSYVEDIVADADFSENTHYSVGGDLEMLTYAMPLILLALILGIVFIYLVMVSQYEPFQHTVIVIQSVPFGIFGLCLPLVITNHPLIIVSFV